MLEARIMGQVGGRMVVGDLCALLGIQPKGKGRLQWVFGYKAGDETAVGVWISVTPGQMWVHL